MSKMRCMSPFLGDAPEIFFSRSNYSPSIQDYGHLFSPLQVLSSLAKM